MKPPDDLSTLPKRSAFRELSVHRVHRVQLTKLVSGSGTHDPNFKTKIVVDHQNGVEREFKFAVFDLNSDEKITDEELIGSVVVRSSQLAKRQSLTLPLSKRGRQVVDCFLVLNPSESSTTLVTKFPVAVAARCSFAVHSTSHGTGNIMPLQRLPDLV